MLQKSEGRGLKNGAASREEEDKPNKARKKRLASKKSRKSRSK